ncbi:E3 ubiquitin-protein ligase TRIM39-like isoform 1-T1 [Pelodytes ibericus]
MASADLRDKLTCSICLNIYTDPVTLTCGHSFCRLCVGNVKGKCHCPECSQSFSKQPQLQRNERWRKVTESFLPSDEPTNALWKRKCSVHKKVLEYYCCEDAVCICVSCRLDGDHRGHKVETVSETSEKKKETLRKVLQKLTKKREESEKRVQSLQEHRRDVQEKAAGVTERVTGLIRDIRDQLEALEKRVLSEISRQEEQVSLRVSDLIRQLEIKKEDLSRKMGHIKVLCNTTDPLTVLQGRESDSAGFFDVVEQANKKVHAVGDLDVALISVTLHTGVDDIVTGVKRRRHALDASGMLAGVNTASDILLDVNTASNNLAISGDLKTVSLSDLNQRRPETPARFQDICPQVLSTRSYSSGRHYWEVETSKSGRWIVGMAYPSIERNWERSSIGYNRKSWGFRKMITNEFFMVHDSKEIRLPLITSCPRLGVYLDYEAGRLSFYDVRNIIKHLHTFTASFTEPLHAAFFVGEDTWARIRN